MKTILTDCDGVLLDWESAFTEWMAKRGYRFTDPSKYNIEDCYGDLTREQGRKLIQEFNDSEAILWLEDKDDAFEWVRKLHFEHGYSFTVISSISDSELTWTRRMVNLSGRFGIECFNRITCLPCGASKEATLKTFPKGLWWIEDKPENAEVGKKLGLRSLLYTADHNKNYETDIPRVNSWKEIHDIIIA